MSRILILEDDEMTMMLYKEILDEENHEIIGVSDAHGILNSLDKKPELILMDMNFPGMSCNELASKIKTENYLKNIPLIIVSGDENIQKFSDDLGARAFLKKPFSLDDFIDTVRRHLPKEH